MMCAEISSDLDPYLDRELDADAAAAIRDHLRTCAGCRRRVAEREAVGRLVRSVPYQPAPAGLRARVAAGAGRRRSTQRLLGWAAAVVLAASLGGAIALVRWSGPADALRPDATVTAVIDAHIRSLQADHLFDVESTDQHTVKPWFLGKLDFSPPVTDLASIGFPLVGGRLEYLSGQPAAALIYRRQKHTINVFIRPARDGDAASGTAQSARGFHVHHWMRNGMSFWAVSDVNEAELAEFVRALQGT